MQVEMWWTAKEYGNWKRAEFLREVGQEDPLEARRVREGTLPGWSEVFRKVIGGAAVALLLAIAVARWLG